MKNHLNMVKQKKLDVMTLVLVEVGKNIRIVVLNNLSELGFIALKKKKFNSKIYKKEKN